MNVASNSLLIDLDGVIYQGDRLIDGAIDTLEWLHDAGIPQLFLTNTTSSSRQGLLDKFSRLGLDIEASRILTPCVSASAWLAEQGLKKLALFVNQQVREEFSAFEVVAPLSEEAVSAVVIGDLGEGWNYQTLNQAFRLLMQQPPPELIALGMTRYWQASDGLRLDVAPFVSALENAADCKARVFGKPAAAFFDSALKRLNSPAERVLMIGDDMVADIGAAQACGIRGIQVKTGKFRQQDLDSTIRPFALIDSIASLPGWWQANLD